MTVWRYVLYAQPTRKLATVISYVIAGSPVEAEALVRVAMKDLNVRLYLGQGHEIKDQTISFPHDSDVKFIRYSADEDPKLR